MLLIGSAAAKFYIPSFRKPADLDLVMWPEELKKFYTENEGSIVELKPQPYADKYICKLTDGVNITAVEIQIAKDGNGFIPLIKAQRHNYITRLFSSDVLVASVRSLIAIKKSHIIFPVKWHKHIADYHVLKSDGGNISHQDKDLVGIAYSLMRKEAQERHSKKEFSFNTTNENFFGASAKYTNRKFEHDDLHRVVAHYDVPMYAKLKDDQTKALCLESKWESLSFEDKVKAVQEEAYVIALERKIIPALDTGIEVDSGLISEAFSWAVMRICTNLTRGWFRDFAIEAWPAYSNSETFDFFDKFMAWYNK